jgi:cytochrome c oxidase assembly factor CtaG
VTLFREPGVLAAVVVAAAWYGLGLRQGRLRLVGRRRRSRETIWRAAALALALVTILVALDSPLERAADSWFWAHMLQHVLLMMVAAPLIVVAAPWMAFWRAFSLRFRRPVARTVVKSPRLAWLRVSFVWIASPVVAWILFNADLAVWHLPSLYDLTLRNNTVHYLEHASFLVLGVLFWAQVIDSPPFASRLGDFERALYATAGAVASWILAVVLAVATRPLYPAYTGHHGLSALSDQQLASGVMWGPGSIPYAIVVFYCLYAWLGTDDVRRRRHGPRTAVGGVPR